MREHLPELAGDSRGPTMQEHVPNHDVRQAVAMDRCCGPWSLVTGLKSEVYGLVLRGGEGSVRRST